MILAVLDDIRAGVPVSVISARFHAGLARATADVLRIVAAREDLQLAVLSGGVFQNRLLLELTLDALGEAGLRVLVPQTLAPNDGQIAFGQVAVAAARIANA
jgi:hydrogenase maturation protein HypF